ncbi:MAG: NAD(P)-dependent oxidoreductase [Pseudomonadota bacterium]
MRVLVTGATGGLGRNLCEHLMVHNYSVLATGRNLVIGKSLKDGGINFQPCDLLNIESLDKLVSGCEVIVHCAALSSAWGKLEDFVQANVVATENLLAACLRQKVRRFIYVSTASVYFNNNKCFGILETDNIVQPMVNLYAATKYQAELLVQVANAKGIETIIIRPRGIFGAYDQNLFPRILKAAKNGFFPLPNNGSAIIDVTYIENLTYALRLAIEAEKQAIGKIYNITNGEPYVVRNLFETLFDITKQKVKLIPVPYKILKGLAITMEQTNKLLGAGEPKLTCYAVGLLTKSQTFNINAARNNLGYIPQISVAEGIKRFATWWRTNS